MADIKKPGFCNAENPVPVRSTGLEPVPIAGHAPQTCAYADSATTACRNMQESLYQGFSRLSTPGKKKV